MDIVMIRNPGYRVVRYIPVCVVVSGVLVIQKLFSPVPLEASESETAEACLFSSCGEDSLSPMSPDDNADAHR